MLTLSPEFQSDVGDYWHVNAHSTVEQEWNGEDSGNIRAG